MNNDLVTDNPQGRLIDILMAKRAWEVLTRHYEGHYWATSCDGVFADVRNCGLSGDWGVRIRVNRIISAADFDRKVMRAGGELLERYHLSRGKFNPDQLAALPTDFAGRFKADS